MTYQDPDLSIVVLDYSRPIESRLCLESIKRHVKIPHKLIFCDNGSRESYSPDFVREGLVDKLIINGDSTGLGLGTRDLFALSQSPYTLYFQNDQLMGRDLYLNEYEYLKQLFHVEQPIVSISLAGAPCGPNTYSERAHLIQTKRYKEWEGCGILGYAGAGRYHDAGPWREFQIQTLYKRNGWIHHIYERPMVLDNGVWAVREMDEGGVFAHRTDTKELYTIVKPTKLNPVYPKFTPEEAVLALGDGWPDGRIPSQELAHSFDCWSNTQLGRMGIHYINDLRRRFKEEKW